jgi:hypothetical protein
VPVTVEGDRQRRLTPSRWPSTLPDVLTDHREFEGLVVDDAFTGDELRGGQADPDRQAA